MTKGTTFATSFASSRRSRRLGRASDWWGAVTRVKRRPGFQTLSSRLLNGSDLSVAIFFGIPSDTVASYC